MLVTFLKIVISLTCFLSDMMYEKSLQARIKGKKTLRARLFVVACIFLMIFSVYQVGTLIQQMEYDLFGAAVEQQQIEETLDTVQDLAEAYKVRADDLKQDNDVITGQLTEANKLIVRLNKENETLEEQLANLRERCGELLEKERQYQARLKVETQTRQVLREQAMVNYNAINERLNKGQ